MEYTLECLEQDKVCQTADLWFNGWLEAHQKILPPQLCKLRTIESFQERLLEHISRARVAVRKGQVMGLYITKNNELYQMYVSKEAQGTGLAQGLIKDAENCIRRAGFQTMWLACAIGNERAKRFYEKTGWKNQGVRSINVDTPEGAFPLEIWYFEKQLG